MKNQAKAQHTPGPWEAVPNGHGDENPARVYVVVKKKNGTEIVLADCSYRDSEESEANALLVAAAPELLGISERLAALRDFDTNELQDLLADAKSVAKKIKAEGRV